MHYLNKIYRKYLFIRKNIHAVLINMVQWHCKTYLTDTVMKQELARRSFYDIFCKLGRRCVILHFLNKIFVGETKVILTITAVRVLKYMGATSSTGLIIYLSNYYLNQFILRKIKF